MTFDITSKLRRQPCNTEHTETHMSTGKERLDARHTHLTQRPIYLALCECSPNKRCRLKPPVDIMSIVWIQVEAISSRPAWRYLCIWHLSSLDWILGLVQGSGVGWSENLTVPLDVIEWSWPFTFLISSKREYCSTLVRRPVQ